MVVQKRKKRENGGTSKRVVWRRVEKKTDPPNQRVFKFMYVPRHTPIAEREDKTKKSVRKTGMTPNQSGSNVHVRVCVYVCVCVCVCVWVKSERQE